MQPDNLHHEKAVLSRIADGDRAAFTLVFNHYQNKLYSVAAHLTGNDHIAQEVVQDVFLRLWLNRAGCFIFERYFLRVFMNDPGINDKEPSA